MITVKATDLLLTTRFHIPTDKIRGGSVVVLYNVETRYILILAAVFRHNTQTVFGGGAVTLGSLDINRCGCITGLSRSV